MRYGIIIYNFPKPNQSCWCHMYKEGDIWTYDINVAFQERQRLTNNHPPCIYEVKVFEDKLLNKTDYYNLYKEEK